MRVRYVLLDSMIVPSYRKKTYTDRYLSFNSNNPINVKIDVVRCLLKRAHEVTTDRKQLKKELRHVKMAFR